jgi:hypothetical protein
MAGEATANIWHFFLAEELQVFAAVRVVDFISANIY